MTTTTRLGTTPAAPPTTNWRALAACQNEDPELFWPIGSSPAAVAQTEAAKKVCWRCPVMQECGQWALESQQDGGVLGGMSEHDRRLLHRRNGRRSYRPGEMRASDHILTFRLAEFMALQAKGLRPKGIALGLGTNVQTVNTVVRKLAERGTEGTVAA